MLTAFKNHLDHKFPDLKGKQLLVAISGGLDSVVLSHLLLKLEYQISFAHCNFNLRSTESDGDEQFVKELAQSFNVNCHSKSFATPEYAHEKNISIQMAARDLRYVYFEELCDAHNLDYICTAHHLDDQIETFLINLNRGAGLDGLQGIPQENGRVLRLLLPFSRNQIKKYAIENNLQWREDSSNSSNKYMRNQLRNEILPRLHNALPNLKSHFLDTLSYLKGSQDMIGDAVSRFRESGTEQTINGIKINVAQLLDTSNPRAYLYELIKEYGFLNMIDAMSLTEALTGKRVSSQTHVLLRDREWLVIDKLAEHEYIEVKIDNIPFNYKFYDKELSLERVEVEDALSLVKKNNSKTIHYLDADKLMLPFTLRNWKNGDRIKPFGMNGSKLVSDVLTDSKVSFIAKEKIVVLTLNEEILWIVGIRASDNYKVTSSTKTLIKLTYII